MNNLEDIVQMAIAVAKEVYRSHDTSALLEEFELKLRRQMMQTSYGKKETTYTITPSTLMGTWNTTTGTRQCPPVIKPEILHG
jgi:hypothetical protein